MDNIHPTSEYHLFLVPDGDVEKAVEALQDLNSVAWPMHWFCAKPATGYNMDSYTLIITPCDENRVLWRRLVSAGIPVVQSTSNVWDQPI